MAHTMPEFQNTMFNASTDTMKTIDKQPITSNVIKKKEIQAKRMIMDKEELRNAKRKEKMCQEKSAVCVFQLSQKNCRT